MPFDIENFKEVGGPGNQTTGGQVYAQWSDEDTIGTMSDPGYLDPLAYVLNVRDLVLCIGTDGAGLFRVIGNKNGVVSVSQVMPLNSVTAQDRVLGVQSLIGPGVVNLTDIITELTTTANDDAFTLAAGEPGQLKIITLVGDGGKGMLTLDGSDPAEIEFDDLGDSAILLWGSNGWAVVGSGGKGGGPKVS